MRNLQKDMPIGRVELSILRQRTCNPEDRDACNYYLDKISRLKKEYDMNGRDSFRELLTKKFKEHYDFVWFDFYHEFPAGVNFDALDSSKKAIQRYVNDMTFVKDGEDKKYTLTDVAGLDIIDGIHDKYTNRHWWQTLDMDVIEYMEKSGIQLQSSRVKNTNSVLDTNLL